ncbi:MAG TPA: sigma-54 dependent transcriptional regulator [Pyrinomonadaceae bacterium]|jgi:DNA-binding NtrC family response regulator|nr:sigma-54 dependent transcriptional regulator [Pyrinomonadaceae bacterium]
MPGRVLIVDNDREHCETLSSRINASGYEVRISPPDQSVTEIAEAFAPTAIVFDPSTEDFDSFGLLRELRLLQPHTPIILTARNSSIESALQAIQEEGAYHYFEKPVDFEKFLVVLERAAELAETRRENEILRRQLRDRGAFGELIGNSETMQRVYLLIEQVASSSASVLITGESGTGKELVARTIHNLSPRRNAPFLAINCSAIPDTLMESELFGHEKGAFTGAVSRRHGCFELANTGTLLLDEIGEMPTLLQAKLLRVLEERVVHRLGSRKDISVDVRLLAATNKEPHGAVRDGTLREDLLYRLNVISIHLPKLSERLEDLPLLTQHLITRLASKHSRPARFISPAALDALRFHSWPGNVRELRNVIERAVVICSGEQIERHHFAPYPFDQRQRLRSEDTVTFPVGTPLREIERQMILRTLDKTGNNKTRAAQLLNISLKTLHNKLNDYRARGLLGDRDNGK